jgi:hypothetical protein
MNDISVGQAVAIMMVLGFAISAATSLLIFYMYVQRCEQRVLPARRIRRMVKSPDFGFLNKAVPIVDSFVAGCFICEECGRRSYFDLITAGTDLLLWPKLVDCQHCGTRFGIVDPSGEYAPQVD